MRWYHPIVQSSFRVWFLAFVFDPFADPNIAVLFVAWKGERVWHWIFRCQVHPSMLWEALAIYLHCEGRLQRMRNENWSQTLANSQEQKTLSLRYSVLLLVQVCHMFTRNLSVFVDLLIPCHLPPRVVEEHCCECRHGFMMYVFKFFTPLITHIAWLVYSYLICLQSPSFWGRKGCRASAHRFNLNQHSGRWETLPSLLAPRCDAAAVARGSVVFLLGNLAASYTSSSRDGNDIHQPPA